MTSRLAWYYYRIRSMSPLELAHRARELCKKRYDRFYAHRMAPVAHDRGALPVLPGLRHELPAALLAQCERYAQAFRQGEYRLLGQPWPDISRERRWHIDPISGEAWSRDFCFDIDYRRARHRGDIKYVWELNRLQYLQPVAALAASRRDDALAQACLQEIESWIDGNPPYSGVNWASGIELALRVVSIVIVVSFVGSRASEAQRAKIWGALEAHALWLERYPSLFSSANNHRAAEGLGLFMIGALCPALPHAARWKAAGWEMLCDTARRQIHSDGIGAEQSPYYTAVVLEMLLLALFVARAAGTQIPVDYTARIALAGEALQWFLDAEGHCPRIGDDDNACVIGADGYEGGYVRSVLSGVAAMLERPDLAPQNVTPHLRDMCFGDAYRAAPAPRGVRVFSQGGYTVGRRGAVMIAMDHGPLGYLSIAAHGHADALAVWLHIGGQPVLVDAGTCLYHSGGETRAFFRGTAAHNTMSVEGQSASIAAGNFNWSHKARVTVTARGGDADHWWVEAEQDGYEAWFGCRHRRRLERMRGGCVIEDQLIGGAPSQVEIGFLVHPALQVEMADDGVAIRGAGQVLVRLVHEGSLAAALQEAWYSPAFGQKIAATRIVFSGRLAPRQKAITRFLWEEEP